MSTLLAVAGLVGISALSTTLGIYLFLVTFPYMTELVTKLAIAHAERIDARLRVHAVKMAKHLPKRPTVTSEDAPLTIVGNRFERSWSMKHACCARCKTTERKHRAHGLCRRCYDRKRSSSKR